MSKIAFLVISSDPYSDVWEPYGELFRKFWPDCPYDTFISSNFNQFDKYGFKTLLMGEDLTWSNGFKIAITQLNGMGYDYVFTSFDDFLLVDHVKTGILKKAVDVFLKEDGNCLRFDKKQCPKIKKYNDIFGEIYNNVPYRMILGFAVWKIDTLLSLIDVNESAWDFEKKGVERSFVYDKFFCTYVFPFKYINLIVKRKLVRSEYKILKSILPSVSINREEWEPSTEIKKAFLLRIFMHYFPVKYQYAVYKKLSKPVKLHQLPGSK